ncbi:unnamed protein product [Closterium sp. NIES-64]|nr:unnamed protein product [Closterium sp. NIES-64]
MNLPYKWPTSQKGTHRSSSPLGSSLASTAQGPPVLLPPGELAGQQRTGPTGPPPPWGARWPAPHRTHRSSSPLGSSLASTAQDPPVLLPTGDLAGQHRIGPTGPPPPWGARWPAPHGTHRPSSPLGSSLASTAQDPPVLLPPGELAGQHRTGPTGPPPPWGARWPAPHRTHRSSSPPRELAGQHRTGPTGPPPPWGARWPAPHRTHRSSSPLGGSLASTAQDPPVLLPPRELAGQHRTGPTGPPPPWGARWPAPHGGAWGCANCLPQSFFADGLSWRPKAMHLWRLLRHARLWRFRRHARLWRFRRHARFVAISSPRAPVALSLY